MRGRLQAWGFKASHAGRVLRGYYASGGDLPTALGQVGLPVGLASRMTSELAPSPATVVARQEAPDGTCKLLLRLGDGRTVESVLMPDYREDRAAGCVSSQVGCAMGCDFCATAQTGFERDLTVGEIMAQFVALRREARRGGRALRTVVFMGMGEPLLNLNSVLEAVRRMADHDLGALGWRQITVSTVGIVPGIEALTEAGENFQLAVSLHAPDDATRERLLPMGRRHRLQEILEAAGRFQARRGRTVILQYCLLAGLNDSPAQAEQLGALLEGRRMHVNLLRYHPTGTSLRGLTYRPSSDDVSERFATLLGRRGVIAHFRRSRGTEIDAACGQLRRRDQEDREPAATAATQI
ncbi:MAG: 23S rRNA (adenine(2503)-C(2))-methyltransferase RlmN [Verrucomicrobiales bacterium]|nr:23S rRNA (adenine(2503)-C(2))-methyltransferase RlmN [Verrucomicrobiales bacterium]